MDAFELVRLRAAGLHEEMAGSGQRIPPLALAELAVRHLDLELAWLPVGDPALKGARGLFDDQTGTICCADEGDTATRAILVAHELGHACLHAASASCADADIDASRSTEAAPVGLQRVEDYGAHERRELHANVFAREFLLPRAEARRCYVTEGRGAIAIAALCELPLDLVRQQLLDALLLPPVPAEEARTGEPPGRPDPSQERAAAHRGSAYQLQAGPGTGKTRTLVKRVLSLLAEGVDPGAILVLTFSNRAAGELADRLAAAAPTAAPRIWIGTFHAFGLDLIRRYHHKLALAPNPPLFDRSDAIEVLEEILPTLPLVYYRNLWDPAMELRNILAAISRAKDEMADSARYRSLAQTMRDRAPDEETQAAAEKALEVAQVYDIYEQALRARQAVDFGDLIMRPALLLEGDAEARAAVQLRHRHVLVDEYQDVNRASGRLLRAVAGDGRRLWVVGDSRQSIYRFRGASAANMARFAREHAGAAVGALGVNYRSTQEVVDTLHRFVPQMGVSDGLLPVSLVSDRGPGGVGPQVRGFDTPDQETAGLAASIRELEASGVPLRDQAVLCRGNSRLNEIAAALEARDISVLHLGSLFERPEVRDLLALLSLAVDPFGEGLARAAAMPRYDIPLQDVYAAARRLRGAPGTALAALEALVAAEDLSDGGRRGLARLAADMAGLPARATAWDFLTSYLLDRTDLLARLASGATVADRMAGIAIWQFLNFIRDRSPIGSGSPIQRVLDRVRQLVLLAEERDLRQIPAGALHMNAVRLMTVHGSKGLEFDAVHVPGVTTASFPTAYRGERCPAPDGLIAGAESLSGPEYARQTHAHEEECLFFVALSRARTHLRLYLTRKQPGGRNRSPSRFLAGLVCAEVHQPATLPLPPGAPLPESLSITWPRGVEASEGGLRLYEQCPRRYFYTHLLKLGGAKKRTAFERTHECLHKLIRWVATARAGGDLEEVAIRCEFDQIWQSDGPTDHAFAADYRHLAGRLVDVLARAGADRRFRNAESLAVEMAHGRVLVTPDEMAELRDGTAVLRRVRTGAKRSEEYDRLEYALYHLAGRVHFGATYLVEALHMADELLEPVSLTARKADSRQEKSDALLASIAAGRFPPDPDPVSCPRCPHFFICAATPRGPLSIA